METTARPDAGLVVEDSTTRSADGTLDLESSQPMQQSLDKPIAGLGEQVRDLKISSREFPNGLGKFEALHNNKMARSLLTGCFESKSSTGGVTKYEGTFLNDPDNERPIPHGQGLQRNADGSTLSGQWKNGFLDGNGEWRGAEPSGESYIGEWKKGKKHGFGVYKYTSGDVYEGDWANGQYQDRGKYTYSNGDEFLGFFEAGNKKHGTFYFKDGRVSRRVWGEHGKLVSSQDYDSQQHAYQPTVTNTQVHDRSMKQPTTVRALPRPAAAPAAVVESS